MTKDDIKELKDVVYELEGLLELAQMREDKAGELRPLIEEKISVIAGMAGVGAVAGMAGDSGIAGDEDAGAGISSEAAYVEEKPVAVRPVHATEHVAGRTPGNVAGHVAERQALPPSPVTGDTLRPAREKPAFCINDRFRFRRELFGNSDRDFSDAMGRVSALESYDEAESYFLNELGWDPERPEVIDFLEIIRLYFDK